MAVMHRAERGGRAGSRKGRIQLTCITARFSKRLNRMQCCIKCNVTNVERSSQSVFLNSLWKLRPEYAMCIVSSRIVRGILNLVKSTVTTWVLEQFFVL